MIKFNFLFINDFQRKVSVRPHYHNCYELIYYTTGAGSSYYCPTDQVDQSINNDIIYSSYTSNNPSFNTIDFYNNFFIIYPPYTMHNEEHLKSANLIAVGFDITSPEYQFTEPKYCADGDLFFYTLMNKMKDEFVNKNYLFNKFIEAMMQEYLLTFLRQSAKGNETNPMVFARSYINEYYTTKISIPELASLSGYSLDHFRILFKTHTGLSPKTYILKKRLEHAKHLLTQTTLPLTTTSTMSGFEDYSQFCSFFKKQTTHNPKDYRNIYGVEKKST